MARPATLSQTAERIRAGASPAIALPEFVDAFNGAPSPDAQVAMLRDEPLLTGNARIDALLGAVAEYLAKQRRLPDLPSWTGHPSRFLAEPWFTVPDDAADGLKEYLAWASPAEFRHRNIVTEPVPLRRASDRRP